MSKEKPDWIYVPPMDRWGRYPTYPAKVGTHSSSCMLVKRTRMFYVGQRIEFALEHELRGMSKSMAPRWRTGIIWKIEDGRLFVNNV